MSILHYSIIGFRAQQQKKILAVRRDSISIRLNMVRYDMVNLKKIVKSSLFIFSLFFSALLGVFLALFFVYQKGLPQIKNLEELRPVVMSVVYDDQNREIFNFAVEKRKILNSTEIPQVLKMAVVISEDQNFFRHWGVNLKGLMRAVLGKILGKNWGGGSSITQQVARNFYLNPEKKLSRKIKETLLAIQIERRYTKEQILTFYLNKIWYGGSVYGVEAASRYFFGKSAREVNLAEAALLAAIIPNPVDKYNVYTNRSRCLWKRNYIIDRMEKAGLVKKEEAEAAKKVDLPEKPFRDDVQVADYFMEEVRKYLEKRYGDQLLYKGGLKVFSTINVRLQEIAYRALRDGLHEWKRRRGWNAEKLENHAGFDPKKVDALLWKKIRVVPGNYLKAIVESVEKNQINLRIKEWQGYISRDDYKWIKREAQKVFKPGDAVLVKVLETYPEKKMLRLSLEQEPEAEGAIIVLDNRSGEIKAMVGGYDFERNEFNRAVQALRQTGSIIKPIIYAAALENGFTPATIIDDLPFSYYDPAIDKVWEPRNYKEDYVGPITFRRALEQSRNVVTARMLVALTPQVGVNYARKFGITSLLQPYMAFSLGAFEVSLLEMTAAFTVFPNNGVRVNPFFIKKVYDERNNLLEEGVVQKKDVLNPETAYVMNYILQGVCRNGTAWKLREFDLPIGGKTGTTNGYTDAWFIGYLPEITVGVWIGHDQKKTLGRAETGAVTALPVFVNFMRSYLQDKPAIGTYRVPANVVFVNIDKYTGKLLTPKCLYAFREAFISGTEPTEFCTEFDHQKIYNYYKTEKEVVEE